MRAKYIDAQALCAYSGRFLRKMISPKFWPANIKNYHRTTTKRAPNDSKKGYWKILTFGVQREVSTPILNILQFLKFLLSKVENYHLKTTKRFHQKKFEYFMFRVLISRTLASATSYTFVRRSARMMSWTFLMISAIILFAERPGRSSSRTDVQSHV